MKILLTGATGYVGKRLLPLLLEQGHNVVCAVRDPNRFSPPKSMAHLIEVVQADLLDRESLSQIPNDIDAAYYLIHSMSSNKDYQEMEQQSALNFKEAIQKTAAKQVIYLSGIANDDSLSKHLESRKNVEEILSGNRFHLTTFRAGIIVGSGSASFEIIRDLVEKLPIMIAPKWLNTRCQPIGIRDVLQFLSSALGSEIIYDRTFDIGGPDILTYKEMLLGFADFRNLHRRIITVPVMTPRLSSYWLYFVTTTSYTLAVSLVESMKVEVVCKNDEINHLLNIEPANYRVALERAFAKIDTNHVVSSWKDSLSSGVRLFNISDFIDVPTHGCFQDKRKRPYQLRDQVTEKIWSIGGNKGWYYANFLWQFRGYIDKLFGGVGLRRGRTSTTTLSPGDALDFWRVLYANKEEGRLLLFAEMKLPGEAWLEFRLEEGKLIQTATFRPQGIMGRLYWYSVMPFHGIVFNGMIDELSK